MRHQIIGHYIEDGKICPVFNKPSGIVYAVFARVGVLAIAAIAFAATGLLFK